METEKQAPPVYSQTDPQGRPYAQGQPYPQGQPYQGQPAAAYPAGGYHTSQPGYQQQPPTVVVSQPVGTSTVLAIPRPPDYMIPSILVCLFCFWPTGLAAIYYSSRSTAMVREGNMAEAERYSTTAKYLLITTVVIGVIWIVIVIAVRVAAASATQRY